MNRHRILHIVTSVKTLGSTGLPSGFWLSELAIPYYVVADAGAVPTVASIKGGAAPIDPESLKDQWQTEETRRFLADKAAMKAVEASSPVAEVSVKNFEAVIVSGGLGTMWDFPTSLALKALLEAFHAAKKPIATVCHGASALVNVTDAKGKPIVTGKTVTCFSNAEEAQIGMTGIVPFLLQTRLGELGAKVKPGSNWSNTVYRDGLLIAGQNPQSAADVTRQTLNALAASRRQAAA